MKVAVIGLGNISNRHRKNLRRLYPQATIYALSASGRMPTEKIPDADIVVESIAELLEIELDWVIVASPAPYHLPHSLPFIQAKIPVLIEKPLSAELTDVKNLLLAQRQYSASVAVGYCLRFLPALQQVKEVLQTHKLGTLYQIKIEVGQYLPDWRPKDYRTTVSASKALGGGALLELSHEIDYAHELFGELTLHSALLKSSQELGLEVEDSADILASTQQGVPLYMHLDFLQREATRTCIIIGSQGKLAWDLIANKVVFMTADKPEVLLDNQSWDKNQMYLSMLRSFYQADEHSAKLATLEQSAQVIAFIQQAKQQAQWL